MRKHLQPGRTQQQSTREAREADGRKGEENVTSIHSPCWFSITICCCLLVLTRAHGASLQGKMLWHPPSMPGSHRARNTSGVRSQIGKPTLSPSWNSDREGETPCHFPLPNGSFLCFLNEEKNPSREMDI